MPKFLAPIGMLIALAVAAGASAQEPPRPQSPPPAAAAPFDQREAWCQAYAAWVVSSIPEEAPRPSDVRPTQRMENEINYCKLDPQDYEQETTAEIARPRQPATE